MTQIDKNVLADAIGGNSSTDVLDSGIDSEEEKVKTVRKLRIKRPATTAVPGEEYDLFGDEEENAVPPVPITGRM